MRVQSCLRMERKWGKQIHESYRKMTSKMLLEALDPKKMTNTYPTAL